MVDYHVVNMIFTDADNERYSIPEQAVNKPGLNEQMRLEMVGFSME